MFRTLAFVTLALLTGTQAEHLITGVVYDPAIPGGRQPLEGVTAQLSDGRGYSGATVTDAQGAFRFTPSATAGSTPRYTVAISKSGYVPIRRENVHPGAALTFVLTRSRAPFGPTGSRTLSGRVLETTATGAQVPVVFPMVQIGITATDRYYFFGYVIGAADGTFRAPDLPDGALAVPLVSGGDGRFRQPCAATTSMQADATVDVEVFRQDTLQLVAPPKAVITDGSQVSGLVYEQTPQGRQAVEGASVYAYDKYEALYALTATDGQGRYWMCRMPQSLAMISVGKDTYQPASIAAHVIGRSAATYDIELRRR